MRRHAEVDADASRAFAHWGEAPEQHESGATGSVLADPDSSGHRLLLVDRPGAAQSELRIGHVGRVAPHAGLSRAAAAEPRAGRAVRQPAEHEPARAQGLHVRRAVVVRVPARPRAVPDVGQRADGRDGGRHSRGARRSVGDARRSAGDASTSWRPRARRSRADTRGTSRRPTRWRAASHSSRCTNCPTTTSRPSCRASRHSGSTRSTTPRSAHLHPDRLVTLVVGDKARVEGTLGGLLLGAPALIAAG